MDQSTKGTTLIERKINGILFGLALVGLLGCFSVNRDLTQAPQFNGVIGSEYMTRVDLVIYRFENDRQLILAAFGDNTPTKEEIKDKFPYWYENIKVMGIFPAGGILKVTQVREEGSYNLSFLRYYGTVLNSEKTELTGKKFDVSFLFNIHRDPIKYKADLIEEVKRQ